MNEERLDLSPLDPTRDSAAWEDRIQAILKEAAPELARRAAGASPIISISEWLRPTLAAAAALAIISLATLYNATPGTDLMIGGDESAQPLAENLSLPMPVEQWLEEERSPTVTELMLALDGEVE